jgi:exodeoxyribonuclease VII small subunit
MLIVVKKTAKKSTKKMPEVDFEKALAELENLVERMEQGDQTLEQSLKDFERGVELTRACQQALKAAEQKVETLLEANQQADLVPFDDD